MTQYSLTIDGQSFEVEIGAIRAGSVQVQVNQVSYQVKIDGAGKPVLPLGATPDAAAAFSGQAMPPTSTPRATPGAGAVSAPIPGKILQLRVKAGERVKRGQVVAVMEAMKMENDILSHIDGMVKEIRTPAGTDVATGDMIMVIE